MTEKMPSSVRFGSRPEGMQHALIFVCGKAVLGDLFGRDRGHGRALAGRGAKANPQAVRTRF